MYLYLLASFWVGSASKIYFEHLLSTSMVSATVKSCNWTDQNNCNYRCNMWRLVSIYISNLLDLPAVTSESASQFKTLLSGTCNTFSLLKQLKLSVNHWNDLLVVMTVRKLNKSTQREREVRCARKKCRWPLKHCRIFLSKGWSYSNPFNCSRTLLLGSPLLMHECMSLFQILVHDCAVKIISFKSMFIPCKNACWTWSFCTEKFLCFNYLAYHQCPMCRSENKGRKCNAKYNTFMQKVL